MNIETILAQSGLCSDKKTGAISTPIYQTATFRHEELGKSTGYDYTRTKNPTRDVLEETMARLEQGHSGFAFATGMAAVNTLFSMFSAGDHILFCDDLYGGTYRLAEKVFQRFGLQFSFCDTGNLKEVEQNLKLATKAVFIETPTNPMMKITDIKKLSQLCSQKKILLIVDNTFLTPLLQRPIELGADLVLHSGSKYLGGHNDVLSGLIVTRTPELSEKIGFLQNSTGGSLAPFDSWLVNRGLKTLAVRMKAAQENANQIAVWLQEQKAVSEVYYPGLKSFKDKSIHDSQSSGSGAMISFKTKDSRTAVKIINSIKVISFAESLGGVESLMTYPLTQTHADVPEAVRNRLGITDNLLRFSVGIEAVSDLLADLEQAIRG